jgi:hypothetical protein
MAGDDMSASPVTQSIVDLLLWHAAERPKRPAFIAGDQMVTFAG